MNRKEYLISQFSGVLSLLLLGCKHEYIAPSLAQPLKKIIFTQVIPEKAMEGGTLHIYYETENIDSLAIYDRVNNSDWQPIANNLDPSIGNFEIQLPAKFDSNSTYSIKISGGGIEALKANIMTEKVVLRPLIEIIKIEPTEAIAEDKLKIFFKTENIQNVLVELKNAKGDFLDVINMDAKVGQLEFKLPNKFDLDESLSINISGNSVFDLIENIPTFNIMKINTNDYSELVSINGIQRVISPRGDIWLKRVSSIEMKAFSGKCTHSGCGIDFIKADNNFNCSCHGSKFTTEGTVINGPANLQLNQFRCVQVSGEEFKLIY